MARDGGWRERECVDTEAPCQRCSVGASRTPVAEAEAPEPARAARWAQAHGPAQGDERHRVRAHDRGALALAARDQRLPIRTYLPAWAAALASSRCVEKAEPGVQSIPTEPSVSRVGAAGSHTAARAANKNVSEFLLDAGIAAANQTLADRLRFDLSPAKWREFRNALDRPVRSKPKLKRMLSKPGALD